MSARNGAKPFGCLRRLGIGLLVLSVVLAVPWTYFDITLGMKLERELGAIRERGEPLTLAEAVPGMPPRDENAADVYEEAFRVFQKWEPTPEGAVPGTRLSDLAPEMQQAVDDFISGESVDLPAEARRWLFSDEIEQRLEAIKRASRMERCVFPVNWEDGFAALFPHLAQFREAQRLVTARMMIAGREGRTGEALEWCKVGLRMSEHVGQEPTLIGLLVRVSMLEALSAGARDILDDLRLSLAEVRSLHGIIAQEDLWRHLRDAMQAERASGLSLLARPADLSGTGHGTSSPYQEALWALYRSPAGAPWRKNDAVTLLTLHDLFEERMERPWREVRDDWPQRDDYVGFRGWAAPITMVVTPVFERITKKRDSAIARMDQFQIALALNLYRQKHGEYPPALEPLAGTMDWTIPDDIFSGEPFGYHREGNGYLLWSVGPDLGDDGGADSEEGDDGDIVWRVQG